MELNILISTLDGGINNIKDVILSPRSDVKYIISHQYTDDKFCMIPPELDRMDVTISQIKGKGLSISRNNVLSLATGDIGLFADDDVTYREQYFNLLKKTFNENPDIDVALFKIKTRPGEPEYKKYPDSQIKLQQKLYSVSSIEVAFKINSIRSSSLSFDERFGAGQELLIGSEESIFIEDCLKNELNVTFVPKYIVEHPYHSTVKSISKYDKRRNWVVGAYDCRTNGSIALLKAFFGTFKLLPDLIQHGVNPFVYFYHRFSAAVYILVTNKKNKL